MQGFYWNSTPGGIWWDSLASLAPGLASAGFSAIWFPPPTKGAAGALSMGYDIYDQYDLGGYNQKGSVPTRFGTRSQLVNAVASFHANGMQVFADAVMGHMNGGEQLIPYQCKPYPSYPDSAYLLFQYPSGSGRFPKDASDFYPNLQTCDVNPPYLGPSDPAFKFGEILAHAQSQVRDSLIVWGKYLRQVIGFDGFRIDEAKSIDPIFVGPWTAQADSGGYAVAEDFDGVDGIKTWLHYCNDVFGGHASMFDFPLRFALQAMCNNTSGTYDMNQLDGSGLVNSGVSGYNVATFAENHDFDRIGWDGSVDVGHNPIIYDKQLAYAYIIFSEGRPCVWFRDYYIYGLNGKIDTLIWIRQNFLYGATTQRSGLNPYYVGSLDDQTTQSKNIYVSRRDGGAGHPACYLVINSHPSEWRGVWVNTSYPGQTFRDYTGVAIDKQAAGDGRVDLWAPPRGYAIYVPDTTKTLNNPPFIAAVAHQTGYINTPFHYQTSYGDLNNDSLTFSLSGAPSWLAFSAAGLLSGTPGSTDTGSSTVTAKVMDTHGDSATASFTLTVVAHPIIDGSFEGTGVWGQPAAAADTLAGWAGAEAESVYVTTDDAYLYLGAKVKAARWMQWAFLLNTKPGGGANDSWSRSIIYSHPDLPDYIVRGTFDGYAEFHAWTGSAWSGVGSPLNTSEFGDDISLDTLQEGWVETRISRAALGNASVYGIQFFITGNQNGNATFDACPNDQNTSAWTGVTTRLHYYLVYGNRSITQCNLQFPPTAGVAVGTGVTVYARAFGVGITDSIGAGAGVQGWIGTSPQNSNPSTWASWVPAAYNVDAGNFDEYQASIGAGLAPGTYYYASRFQYAAGPYVYGGYSSSGGGIWDSVRNISGILTVYGPPGTPTLDSPADSAGHQPATIVLKWLPLAQAQSYCLQVAADENFSVMIFDDSSIVSSQRQVGPLGNKATYHWRVRAKNVAGVGAYSIPRTFTVDQTVARYRVAASWNLVSLPMAVYDPRPSAVFAAAVSNAFSYDPDRGYVSSDTLREGVGYWLKFATAESIAITGYATGFDTIEVVPGWNLIGSLSAPIPVDSIVEVPSSNVTSEFFGYDGGYFLASVIEPAKGYWVKVDSAGKLILGGASLGFGVLRARTPSPQLVSVTLEDASGHSQELYIGAGSPAKNDPDAYLLPPPPPQGSFDARFSSGKYLETVGKDQRVNLRINLSSVEYPVRIVYHGAAEGIQVALKSDGRIVRLSSDCPIAVNGRPSSIEVEAGAPPAIPRAFALYQNYPNPFNPETRIGYALPVGSHVRLRIYDLLGKEVRTLVDLTQTSGVKEAVWNGENDAGLPVTSGMYLYRLEAAPVTSKAAGTPPASFVGVKKLLLIR